MALVDRWSDFLHGLLEQDRLLWTDSPNWPEGYTPSRIRYMWTGPLGVQVSELTFEAWVNQQLGSPSSDKEIG